MRRKRGPDPVTCYVDETGTFGTGFLGVGFFTPTDRFPRSSLVPAIRYASGTPIETKNRLAKVPVLHATDDPKPLKMAVLEWIRAHVRGMFHFVWVGEEAEAALEGAAEGHKEVLDLLLKFGSGGLSCQHIEVEQRPGLDAESISGIAQKNDAALADVLARSQEHPLIAAVKDFCTMTGESYVVKTKGEATAGLQVIDYLCWLRWREYSQQDVPLRLEEICIRQPVPRLNDAPVEIEAYSLGT